MRQDRRSEQSNRGGDKQVQPLGPRTFRSAEMFAGAKEVIIEHEGAIYRLRQTSQGKLILTK